jgi:hypothetical protein
MAESVSLPGLDVFSHRNLPPEIASTIDENASSTRRSRIHLSQGLGDFCFLSFLQVRRNRLLLESIVVLSLESHVGSVYRSSRLSIRSAIKKPPKNSPAENRISSEFLDFTPFYRVERGKQKGTLKEFLFVSRGEYDRVGYKAAKRNRVRPHPQPTHSH